MICQQKKVKKKTLKSPSDNISESQRKINHVELVVKKHD